MLFLFYICDDGEEKFNDPTNDIYFLFYNLENDINWILFL